MPIRLTAVLTTAMWLIVTLWVPASSASAADSTPISVVYHLDDSQRAIAAFRNIGNHLAAMPKTRIVVVALGLGVDFLMEGAMDDRKNPYEPMIDDLIFAGVEFRVCNNTLTSRGIEADELHPDITLVSSGVAEIARLQAREAYAYLKP